MRKFLILLLLALCATVRAQNVENVGLQRHLMRSAVNEYAMKSDSVGSAVHRLLHPAIYRPVPQELPTGSVVIVNRNLNLEPSPLMFKPGDLCFYVPEPESLFAPAYDQMYEDMSLGAAIVTGLIEGLLNDIAVSKPKKKNNKKRYSY